MAKGAGAEDMKNPAFVLKKTEQKGKLSVDPMVELSWKFADYSAPTEKSVSMVGKSMGMSSATSRGFAPQIVGVGQMKLEAPPQYLGKRQPGV